MEAIDWRTLLTRLPQRIWFRLVVFAAAALALVAVARWAGPWLPDALAVEFGQDAALRILEILASSMLAVTTFSLTAMISAYAAAARGTTPRATQLLIADPTSQNALSTFLGTFVFSIVGVIALSTESFTEQGRSLLFIGTLVVIAVVVGTLLRWIHHLTQFGRVPDVIDRVERAATQAVRAAAQDPHLGGVAPVAVPEGARTVTSHAVGSVTGIAVERLQERAKAAGATVHVDVLPGSFVGRGTVLARVVGPLSNDDADALRDAFRVERHRTYEQDPRLGLVALAEIGSRALSPAVNDPGTAVEVLGAIQRVVTELLCGEASEEPTYDRVHVPAVELTDVVEDAFRPLARDGAPMVEVGLRIQRVLSDLRDVARGPADVAVLREASARAAERSLRGLDDAGDADAIRAKTDEAQRFAE
ncbi:DUF2254 domain-containing protein [Demequina sp. TTPB684]|uniref:DUF2254 domain-containing protein n=1 Tax=unclassified Demequina TaxID=2620311 RepID=UPI001CF1E922|nr:MULTISPECIES: DUF2254 domain-containing protein [unclassified Demequina]MCB2413057.1 DUF2254 domain-containing protein [Demequina sp. TTPB684]UPU88134.1 DUF2254 domain-containing protein [Demequina sp. TMPB413]